MVDICTYFLIAKGKKIAGNFFLSWYVYIITNIWGIIPVLFTRKLKALFYYYSKTNSDAVDLQSIMQMIK